jgi:Skp family chaperone for outer membrane proteins
MSVSSWLLLSLRLVVVAWTSCILTLNFALQIGVVDDMVVLRSPPLQAMIKPSTAKIAAGEKELETLSTQFQKTKAEFDKNEMIMDEKTRDQKQRVLLSLSKQWQAKMVALEKERNIIQTQVEQRLQDVYYKVAKQQKLNILFSKMRGVVYADAGLDVTTQVVNGLAHSTMTVDAQSATDATPKTNALPVTAT